MRPSNHLVIFVKAPRLGAVKTRLAVELGVLGALRFYRATSTRVVRRLAGDPRWNCWLAVTPDRFARVGRFWPHGVPRMAQGAGDLGARMARPLESLPPGPVVIVGSDVPGITADHVARAFRALGSAHAVFGPAGDGGYWLVGLRRRPARLNPFRAVPWSTDQALARTLANLDGRQKVACLDMLEDVDDMDGWRRWRAGL
jgi:rSAM/selenodomain-associated transferase 1